MLSNLSKLQLQIENKSYQFLCDNDSPLQHVKEALFQLQKYVGQIEDNIKAQQEQAASQQKPLEPTQEIAQEDPKVEELKQE